MDCCDNNKKSNIKVSFEGLICFCFKHSKKELFDAINNNSEETIVEDIKAKMKNPGCFCEKSNPSGKCCMADVKAFIKQVKSKEKT